MTDDTTTALAAPSAKTYPGNTWIVTAYRFARHGSIKTAQMEHARLSIAYPDRTFEILRVKNSLEPSDSAGRIRTLERLVEHLTHFLTDVAGADMSAEGLEALRRRCANALPDDKCPDWLKRYRSSRDTQTDQNAKAPEARTDDGHGADGKA